MLCEAKYKINQIFEDVGKKLNSENNELKMKVLHELKEKVNEAMQKNDTLNKWSHFQNTKEYILILNDFENEIWSEYHDMAVAKYYFQKPYFFNED